MTTARLSVLVVQANPDGTTTPLQGRRVRAVPSIRNALIQQQDGSFALYVPDSLDAETDQTGTAILTLPTQSSSQPASLLWTIITPDGTSWVGPVTDVMAAASVSAPIPLTTATTAYGWGAGSQTVPVVGVQGLQGVQGPPGVQGPQGVQGPAGTAPSGTPNKVVATDPSGSATNPATLRALVPQDLPLSTIAGTGLQGTASLLSLLSATKTSIGGAYQRTYDMRAYGTVWPGAVLTDDSGTGGLTIAQKIAANTSAMNAAIAAAVADGNNARALCPWGMWRMNPLTPVNAGNWTLAVEGLIIPDNQLDGGTSDFLQVNIGQATQQQNVTIDACTFYTADANATRTGGALIALGNLDQVSLRQVRAITNGANKYYEAIRNEGASDATYRTVRCSGGYVGYHFKVNPVAGTNNFRLVEHAFADDCVFSSHSSHGMLIENNYAGGTGCSVEGIHLAAACSLYNNAGYGCYLDNSAVQGTANQGLIKTLHFLGATLDTNALGNFGMAVVPFSAPGSRVFDVQFESVRNAVGGGTTGDGIYLGPNVDEFHIVGGNHKLAGRHGVYVNGARNGKIAVADFANNNQGHDTNGNTGFAIAVDNGAAHVKINGNRVYNDASQGALKYQNGLTVDTSCIDVRATDNYLDVNINTGTTSYTPFQLVYKNTGVNTYAGINGLYGWGNTLDSTLQQVFWVQGPAASVPTSGTTDVATTMVNKFTIDSSGNIATGGFGIGGVIAAGGFPADSGHVTIEGGGKFTQSGKALLPVVADLRPNTSGMDTAQATISAISITAGLNPGDAGSQPIYTVCGLYSGLKTNASYSSAITNVHAAHVANMALNGTGPVTTQVGLYVETLSGASTNYAIYTNGTTPSVFGGAVTVGSLSTTGTVSCASVSTTNVTATGTITASGAGAKITATGGGIIDATVLSGPISANTDLWTPGDFGSLKAQRYPIDQAAASSSTGTAPFLWLFRIKVEASISVSNIVLGVNVAGATLANCYAGLYNASGTLIGTTADQSSAWTSAGLKSMALTGGPFALTPGYYYVAVQIGSATTQPQFAATAGSTNAGITNVGLSGAGLHAAAMVTPAPSNGAMPAAITMTANSALGRTLWAALS